MGRKYIDCREHPTESRCTIAIFADTEDELIEAVVQHAMTVHGHEDTPTFRQELRQAVKEAEPVGQLP